MEKNQSLKPKTGFKKGAAALSVVLVVSGIILTISIASALISVVRVNSSLIERLGAEALFIARAGAQDAIARVLRYKNCPSSQGCPSNYRLDFGNNKTADIEIRNSGTLPANSNFVCSPTSICIISIGTAIAKKEVVALVSVDSITGELRVQFFSEVPLNS